MYRFEARIIGRSQGKSATKAAAHNTGKRNSAVKAAAYLSRSELTDAKGQTWDYSDHFGGGGALLLLPDGTPKQFRDREFLWRDVERIENRKDSMLARDPIITMPWQLTQKEMWSATKKFANQEFVSQGKPVDLGLHIYGEPWNAWTKATKAKVEEWKEKKYPFYEQAKVPEDCTGPHVLIVRGKRDQIKAYHLYQPHMHLMTTFRSLDPESPTGWAKYKDTVTDGHWAVQDRNYIDHLKKAWAEIGADALLAKGLTVNADRFRVGYLTIPEQRKAAIGRGDHEWADQLNRKAEPKKGPIAAKMEREDRGDESKAVLQWMLTTTGNRVIRIDTEILRLEEAEQKRKKTMATEDQVMRDVAERQERRIDKQVDDQQESLAELRKNSEATRRFFDQIEGDKQEGERLKRDRLAGKTQDDITDARQRFLEAASERFDIRRPEASLSETVGVEGARAKQEHHNLTTAARLERDPDKRADILLQRDIGYFAYMAITEERQIHISKFIAGPGNRREYDDEGRALPTQAEKHQSMADYYKEREVQLREERQQLHELMDIKFMNKASDHVSTLAEGRERGPVPSEPARYQVLNEQHERVGDTVRREADFENTKRQHADNDRREMHRAMQTERQITNPHHEVTGRVSEALQAVREVELTPAMQRAEEKRQTKNEERIAANAAAESVRKELPQRERWRRAGCVSPKASAHRAQRGGRGKERPGFVRQGSAIVHRSKAALPIVGIKIEGFARPVLATAMKPVLRPEVQRKPKRPRRRPKKGMAEAYFKDLAEAQAGRLLWATFLARWPEHGR